MKGLFLFCSLLSLVGFTNSLSDKGQLAKLKEEHHQLKEKLEKMKEDRRSHIDKSSDLMNNHINIIAPPMDFLPLEALMKKTKDSWVNMKSYIDQKNYDLGVKIETLERELKESEIIINSLEEQEARSALKRFETEL